MKDYLLKILELSNFEGNKEEWVNEAIGGINLNIIGHLLSSLDSEKQKKVEDKLKGADVVQQLPQVLSEFFTQEQMEAQIQKSSGEFIEKYLESIFPNLPPDQQKAVEDYFNSATPAA